MPKAVSIIFPFHNLSAGDGEAWWNARCRQALVTIVGVKPRPAALLQLAS
jgi:hypothetical protein